LLPDIFRQSKHAQAATWSPVCFCPDRDNWPKQTSVSCAIPLKSGTSPAIAVTFSKQRHCASPTAFYGSVNEIMTKIGLI